MTDRTTGMFFTGLALIMALGYDLGFYEKGLGLNFLVFTFGSVLLFLLVALKTKVFRNTWALTLLIPLAALATAPALYENEYATYAAPILTAVLWFIFTMCLTIEYNGLSFYLTKLPLFQHLDALVSNWKDVYRDLFTHEQGYAKRIVWGLIISFPILAIFTGLLASADQIFADWLKNLNIWEGIWRFFRTLMITLLASGFFYLLISEKNQLKEKITKVFKLDTVTVGIVLALVNALFGLFVYIQIKYLFGGAEFVISNHMTLAQYARSGFFELVRVVILAGILIIGVHRSFAKHGTHWAINVLQALFIAQVAVVGASALRRMGIYQEAFGFTSMRLYVQWFIYAVLGSLVFSGISLIAKIEFRRFYHAMLSLMVVVAAGVSLINIDNLIAAENITRFEAGKSLDISYLTRLSRDATPALARLVETDNLSKLNVTQIYSLQSLFTQYTEGNASTTPFATTWASYESKKILPGLLEKLAPKVKEADAKSKRYNDILNELSVYDGQYANCLSVEQNSKEERAPLETKPIVNPLNCRNLTDSPDQTIQVQIVNSYNPNNEQYFDATSYPNKQIYRIVRFNKVDKQSEIIFTYDLPTTMDPYAAGAPYRLKPNGDLIEENFDAREVYIYSLSRTTTTYTLSPKKQI